MIINNGEETIIHEPTANQLAPHLLSLPLKESLNQAEEFSFDIPYGNDGYNLIEGLISKVKIIDTRDDSVVCTGRVVPTKDSINDKVIMNVQCEGAMNYLNDTQTRRWHLSDKTPQEILQYLLDQHNSKVDDSRKIYLGTVEITTAITVDTNLETTLNAIVTKVRNILGGDIRVQERNNKLYLDYLTDQGANNEVVLRFLYNVQEFLRNYDPLDLITRGIPMGYGEGINQLDITSVNNGVEYIEDVAARNKYGIIEGVITNKDIQNALTLKTYGQTVLNEKKQPAVSYEISSKDLSVLTGHEHEKYDLGDTIHTIINVLNVDVYARVIERERDLLINPWDPKLTISTRPITLTDQIIDLKQRNLTLENAPQGNTCMFALTKAENADSTHPITFDLDIPEEAININKAYINLHGRKYRAYEKSVSLEQIVATSGPSSKTTSDSGGQSTQTSSSGGSSTQTSTAAGQSTQTSSAGGSAVVTSNLSAGLSNVFVNSWKDSPGVRDAPSSLGQQYVPTTNNGSTPSVDLWWFSHTHDIDHTHKVSIPEHTHTVQTPSHTHNVNIPSHTHSVEIPNHSHGMDHTHEITIPAKELDIKYGIYEGTYPKNVKIKINGEDVGVSYSGDSEIDEYNIDITSKVTTGNNKIEITTEQNGRIEAIVYSQIFIQSK
ncbi:MAG: phage minor structural protein [Anaerocolumna sp.]|nr:phage minor structural protein [Anaerocolumna sp.]